LIQEDEALREVDQSQIDVLAKSINAETWLTSAKTGESVDELFNRIATNYSEAPPPASSSRKGAGSSSSVMDDSIDFDDDVPPPSSSNQGGCCN
jgi:hypothetical protein